MSTFELKVIEDPFPDDDQCAFLVIYEVSGVVAFSQSVSRNRSISDVALKRLRQRIRKLSKGILVLEQLNTHTLCVSFHTRFLIKKYARRVEKEIRTYCSIEAALVHSRPNENADSLRKLMRELNCLLTDKNKEKFKRAESKVLRHYITSIIYGISDVLGGPLRPRPRSLEPRVIKEWLRNERRIYYGFLRSKKP